MLALKSHLTAEEFHSTEVFLQDKITSLDYQERAFALLAELYNHKADELRLRAEYYAKEALELAPEEKINHLNLQRAQQGTIADWNYANHNQRIDYYKGFIKKNPTYPRGYLWLLDELIADLRLDEARSVVDQMKTYDDSCRVPYYQGNIEWAAGKQKEAKNYWNQMILNHQSDWMAQNCMGMAMASIGEYELAISYFKKGYALQPSPKYTDAAWSIAQIHELQGDYTAILLDLEEMLAILKNEWHMEEGAEVERINQEITRIKKLITI